MKTLYKFPFSDLKSVKDEIGSRTFSSWINGNITTGTIINKTNIYETNNYSLNRIAYLIKDDKFKVKKISSRWLEIKYTNKNGHVTEGWIMCKDTNICN